jgi:pyruvate kinase
MAPKTGSDLEEIRALLAEVKALREDVELKGAELRSSWGADADKSKAPPRVLNLSHYIALRAHDITDLQYRLASRGLSSLGRSESHVAQALDALIATLKRLSGESSAPYPAPVLARAGAAELEGRPISSSAGGKKTALACGSRIAARGGRTRVGGRPK